MVKVFLDPPLGVDMGRARKQRTVWSGIENRWEEAVGGASARVTVRLLSGWLIAKNRFRGGLIVCGNPRLPIVGLNRIYRDFILKAVVTLLILLSRNFCSRSVTGSAWIDFSSQNESEAYILRSPPVAPTSHEG